jgi:hypothetical protein
MSAFRDDLDNLVDKMENQYFIYPFVFIYENIKLYFEKILN